jgi:23S rRNA (cytosine1962-C5)-methyltransferase
MQFTDFENRLRKVYRHISKWAARERITCYRVYDNDIPEFPLAVDIYEGRAYIAIFYKEFLEREMPLDAWVERCQDAIAAVLSIPHNLQFLKIRQRQRGTEQYEKQGESGSRFVVKEHGLQFWVNLQDYLDTGLFLDHRNTRAMVKACSQGKRMLNLFAYTGSFSVFAAAGGAARTTTMDLSHTYLRWAEDNMRLNGFSGPHHRFVQGDVMSLLPGIQDNSEDLIVLDPPTFSNSKRMNEVFDVQRDHVFLINQCYRILAPGGQLYFSTNYRGFKMDDVALDFESVEEITHKTIPQDFRNKKIHRCFLMGK